MKLCWLSLLLATSSYKWRWNWRADWRWFTRTPSLYTDETEDRSQEPTMSSYAGGGTDILIEDCLKESKVRWVSLLLAAPSFIKLVVITAKSSSVVSFSLSESDLWTLQTSFSESDSLCSSGLSFLLASVFSEEFRWRRPVLPTGCEDLATSVRSWKTKHEHDMFWK